jgi:hypothetical protein
MYWSDNGMEKAQSLNKNRRRMRVRVVLRAAISGALLGGMIGAFAKYNPSIDPVAFGLGFGGLGGLFIGLWTSTENAHEY